MGDETSIFNSIFNTIQVVFEIFYDYSEFCVDNHMT